MMASELKSPYTSRGQSGAIVSRDVVLAQTGVGNSRWGKELGREEQYSSGEINTIR